MLIGYCPDCHKAGLRCGDRSVPLNRIRYNLGTRYCPCCQKWVTPLYRGNAERKERLSHR